MKTNHNQSKQYTIRGIPLPIDRALRRFAEQRQLSINQVLVMSLEQFTGMTPLGNSDLKRFAGAIPTEQAVTEALAQQRKVSDKDWS